MTKTATAPPFILPADAKFVYLDGAAFVPIKQSAKLGGLSPVVLEMGQKLLAGAGNQGAAFLLATPEMKSKALEIEALIVKGLRKVAKALGNGASCRVKSVRDGDRLVFWYSLKA